MVVSPGNVKRFRGPLEGEERKGNDSFFPALGAVNETGALSSGDARYLNIVGRALRTGMGRCSDITCAI